MGILLIHEKLKKDEIDNLRNNIMLLQTCKPADLPKIVPKIVIISYDVRNQKELIKKLQGHQIILLSWKKKIFNNPMLKNVVVNSNSSLNVARCIQEFQNVNIKYQTTLGIVNTQLIKLPSRTKIHESIFQAKQLQALVTSTSNGIIFLTKEGIIRAWNNGAVQIFGIQKSIAINSSIQNMGGSEWKKTMTQLLMSTRSTSKSANQVFLGKNGKILSIVLTKVDEQSFILEVHDATSLYQDRKALTEKIAELEKWEKLTVGRELRIAELKKKLKELEGKKR